MFRTLTAILLLCLCASAADTPKYPDWPVLPPVWAPMPVKTDPIPASELPYDKLYVVQSDEDVQLVDSPLGRVKIETFKGPVTINGVFVDGKGKRETRTYDKKQVFLIERVGDGTLELMTVPKGPVFRRAVTDPQNPIPPPKPKPDDPKPTTEKSPWDNAPGLRVLIVYPLRGSLPAEQQAIISGKRVRDYLDAKTAQDIGGKAYRIWKTGEDVSGTEPGWQRAYATLKGDRWVVIGNATRWTAEPMPENADKMLELLRKYE